MDNVIKGLAWYTLVALLVIIVSEIAQIGQVVKLTTTIAAVATILLVPCIALAVLVLIRKHHAIKSELSGR
jgi:O-antigen ligase